MVPAGTATRPIGRPEARQAARIHQAMNTAVTTAQQAQKLARPLSPRCRRGRADDTEAPGRCPPCHGRSEEPSAPTHLAPQHSSFGIDPQRDAATHDASIRSPPRSINGRTSANTAPETALVPHGPSASTESTTQRSVAVDVQRSGDGPHSTPAGDTRAARRSRWPCASACRRPFTAASSNNGVLFTWGVDLCRVPVTSRGECCADSVDGDPRRSDGGCPVVDRQRGGG